MSEMVERVARASFDFWKATQPGKEHLQFEDLNNVEHEMEFALAHARALIAAMRVPTVKMIDAVDLSIPTEGEILSVWSSMIDAILEEK